MNRAELDAAMADAQRPRLCRGCGRLLVGSAYTLHFEGGEGSRCLPDSRLDGVLEVRDGAWVMAGSGPVV